MAVCIATMVSEIGETGRTDKHMSRCSDSYIMALVVQNADVASRHRPPDCSGLAQRLFRRVEHGAAGFAAAIIFVDDRPPPFDHCALYVGRAGRGPVRDKAQGRKIMFVARRLRQFQ